MDIEKINRQFLDEGRQYILIGPGRWGSSDPWLGVPVKWPAISAARVIVEVTLPGYRVDPSQGTHFFQNLTSFGVGYFTIGMSRESLSGNSSEGETASSGSDEGLLRKDILDAMPAVDETPRVRHVRFSKPLKIMMDGRKQEGAVVLE